MQKVQKTYTVEFKRVARLMREQGLFAQRPRHRTITTKSEQGAPVAPNLLQRDFNADEPNSKWVADTTDIGTRDRLVVPGGGA